MTDTDDRLSEIGKRLLDLGAVVRELSRERRIIVRQLHDEGNAHADVAAVAGLSRGRIHRILNVHQSNDQSTSDGAAHVC